MPPSNAPDFATHVWRAAARVGRSAPRIVDAILAEVFPQTFETAEAEGAGRILRTGCIAEVKRVFRTEQEGADQSDFAEIDPSFQPLVARLQRPAYYVPGRDEEVPVGRLIQAPHELDEARLFMRRKGMECLAEADRLDRLYEAVTDAALISPASDSRRARPTSSSMVEGAR